MHMGKCKQKKQMPPTNTRGHNDKVSEVISFIGPRYCLKHPVSLISWDHRGSNNASGDKKVAKANAVTMGERYPLCKEPAQGPNPSKYSLSRT